MEKADFFDLSRPIVLNGTGKMKFMLIQIQGRLIIRGGIEFGQHCQIVKALSDAYEKVYPLGGSKINIRDDLKRITFGDASADYGAPDYELVSQILKRAYPEYEIIGYDRRDKEIKY